MKDVKHVAAFTRDEVNSLGNRKLRDAAFRDRASTIGILQSCLCTFPLERFATATGHAEICPAHSIALEHERLAKQTTPGEGTAAMAAVVAQLRNTEER